MKVLVKRGIARIEITEIMRISQHDVESRFYDVLKYGDIRAIADILGRSEGSLSPELNPAEDRRSIMYRAVEFLVAWCEVDRERGLEALDLLVALVRFHTAQIPVKQDIAASLADEIGAAAELQAEVIMASADGEITPGEATTIRTKIRKEREALERLEESL